MVIRALLRERRRLNALRDAAIYRAAAGGPDDLDGLADYAVNLPSDID